MSGTTFAVCFGVSWLDPTGFERYVWFSFASVRGTPLAPTTRRVRRSVRLAYCEAPNVDTGHYGAMRGLEFA